MQTQSCKNARASNFRVLQTALLLACGNAKQKTHLQNRGKTKTHLQMVMNSKRLYRFSLFAAPLLLSDFSVHPPLTPPCTSRTMSGYGGGFATTPRSPVAEPGGSAPLAFSMQSGGYDAATNNSGAVAVPMPGTPPAYGGYQGQMPASSAPPPAPAPAPMVANDPAGMMAVGPRGDFVTRTWQPTEAPDESMVESLMLGPLNGAAAAEMAARNAGKPLEDDGLIVRQLPKARGDNIARRKQRSMSETNPEDWFDPNDGGLRCLADPVPPGSNRARPARWFDPDAPYLQLKPGSEYHIGDDALIALAAGGVGVGIAGAEKIHRLEVKVGRLEFSAHPLMGREDHLASTLEEAFRSYKRREAAGLVALYEAKATAATARANALNDEITQGTAFWLGGASPAARLQALTDESNEATRLASDELERQAGSVKHMMDLQTAIDRVRTVVGTQSTGVKLVVYQDENGSVDPVLTLENVPEDPSHLIPKWELQRRTKMQNARFCVALEVNRRVVPGTSQPQFLRHGGTSFSLEVGHAFVLSVSKWPSSMRVLVFEKGLVMDTFIAAVPVVVPGANVGDALADAAFRQYQFSAEEPWTPLWEQTGMQLIAQVRVGDGVPSQQYTMQTGSNQQYTSGSLFVQCAWVPGEEHGYGQHDVEASRNTSLAPPPPPSTAARRAAAAAKVGYADAAGGFGMPGSTQTNATDAALDKSGISSLRATLDPLNPDDAALLETLATRDAVRSSGGGGFRLNKNDETMLGYSVKASKRQQLLKLRAAGESLRTELPDGGVPLTDDSIPDHLLDKSSSNRNETQLITSQLPGLAEADERASRIAEFLNKVKLNVQKGKRVSKAGAKQGQGPVHTDDVVKDAPLPDITFDFTGVFEWFQPVRKLRPVRRRTAAAESHPDRCELVVNVQKAFNLPQRAARSRGSQQGGMGGRGGFQRGGYGGYGNAPEPMESTELSTFVEITFQGSTQRTRLANGSSPSWQESLSLPFRPPGGDFSAAALQGSSDVVHITMFDDRPEAPEQGQGYGQGGYGTQSGENAGNSQSHTSKHYLGSIDIPIAALYRADGGKLEGMLPIDCPPVMLGYDGGKSIGRSVSIKAIPALSVYIQFNPALAKPEPVSADAGPGEEEALKRHAKNWEKDARAVGRHCKYRPFRAIATDAMGRSVHLSRYCSPSALPPGFEGATADEATLRQLLRFCHLVPNVSDMDAFNLPAGIDIWTTTAEFLDMCAGDSEEHALLLLGFLQTLGVEAYVILGVSAADSDAAMVFTPGGQGRRPGQTSGSPPVYTPLLDDALIWDPIKGTMFSVYDSAAGALMGEVAVVFNHENIWANVSPSAKPHDMQWNLGDYTSWRPFFSPSTLPQRQLPTRQRRVTYESFDPAFYERLAAAVEREAMDAIVKTRQRQHTPFNRRASRALKDLLRELESHALISPEEAAVGVPVPGGPPSARVSLAELHQGTLNGLLEGYDIVGYPLNSPFTDAAEVRSLVERTRVAETNRKDVEFAVATHVEPYGQTFVCSIWVYVARLTKKNT